MKKILQGELYTVLDMAEALGIGYSTLFYRLKVGLFPEPTFCWGRRKYYTETEFRSLIQQQGSVK